MRDPLRCWLLTESDDLLVSTFTDVGALAVIEVRAGTSALTPRITVNLTKDAADHGPGTLAARAAALAADLWLTLVLDAADAAVDNDLFHAASDTLRAHRLGTTCHTLLP